MPNSPRRQSDSLRLLPRAAGQAQARPIPPGDEPGNTAAAPLHPGRHEWLARRMAPLRPVFSDFDRLLHDYLAVSPFVAGPSPSVDDLLFLSWLRSQYILSARQLDHLACLQARIEVEDELHDRRADHERFQELLRRCRQQQLAERLHEDGRLILHLNPIRVRTRFESDAFLDADAPHPAVVLFFPLEGEIRAVALDSDGLLLIDSFTAAAPCELASWLCAEHPLHGQEAVDLCTRMVHTGLLAVEEPHPRTGAD